MIAHTPDCSGTTAVSLSGFDRCTQNTPYNTIIRTRHPASRNDDRRGPPHGQAGSADKGKGSGAVGQAPGGARTHPPGKGDAEAPARATDEEIAAAEAEAARFNAAQKEFNEANADANAKLGLGGSHSSTEPGTDAADAVDATGTTGATGAAPAESSSAAGGADGQGWGPNTQAICSEPHALLRPGQVAALYTTKLAPPNPGNDAPASLRDLAELLADEGA